jgi:flagellar protein FliT
MASYPNNRLKTLLQHIMAQPDQLKSMEAPPSFTEAWMDTQKMLGAARAGDWDGLVQLESNRQAKVDQILQINQSRIKDQELVAHQSELIRNILSTDEEIKRLTRSWMDKIQQELGVIGVDKRLQQAYVHI